MVELLVSLSTTSTMGYSAKKTSKFIILFTLGYRLEAFNIIGQEVMFPRGLLGLGTDTLDQSGAEIRETLSLYTSTSSLPSIVHCTHGKDRTGRSHQG